VMRRSMYVSGRSDDTISAADNDVVQATPSQGRNGEFKKGSDARYLCGAGGGEGWVGVEGRGVRPVERRVPGAGPGKQQQGRQTW
jgi:hypothetical protein